MTNLSNLVINPDTEIVIIMKSDLDNLNKKIEDIQHTNEVQQSLMRSYFDDIHKLKKENKELKKRYEPYS